MYFPKHIREIPADPSSTALPLPPPEQVPSIQDLTLDAEASTGVGRGKEGLPPANDAQSEDTFTIRDVVSQAKVAKKPKAGDAKSKTVNTKEDPQPTKKQLQDFLLYLLLFSFSKTYVIACNTSSLELMNELFLLFPRSLLFVLFILIIIANKFELLLLHFQCVLIVNHY